MYIDTHSHLNFNRFKDDYRDCINRAMQNEVRGIVNVGSNLETSKKAIEIAEKYEEGIYAAIGLHPIHIHEEIFNENQFIKMVKNPKVVAIGETGLDYYHDSDSKDNQKELFKKLISLAQKNSKPVILHSRDAGEDVLGVLMEEKNLPKGVMHCFQGNWQYAKVILDLGFYISFTGLITFGKNLDTIDVIKNIPLDKLLIETDCPYLTPEPYRGKRNEPLFVIEIAKKIAEIKKVSLEKIAKQTSENAIRLFRLDQLMLK